MHFLKEMESLSNINYNLIIKYGLLPKLCKKPNVKKNHTLSEQFLFEDITSNVQQHYNKISTQIISSLDQIKTTYFQMNKTITQIASENPPSEFKLFRTQSVEHALTFPPSVQNNNCFLRGVGYVSQVFEEIPNSGFIFEIIEKK